MDGVVGQIVWNDQGFTLLSHIAHNKNTFYVDYYSSSNYILSAHLYNPLLWNNYVRPTYIPTNTTLSRPKLFYLFWRENKLCKLEDDFKMSLQVPGG